MAVERVQIGDRQFAMSMPSLSHAGFADGAVMKARKACAGCGVELPAGSVAFRIDGGSRRA